MRYLALVLLASCASDPYLAATVDCVANAPSRAAADACRAALQPKDGGADVMRAVVVTSPPVAAAKDGGAHGG